MKEIVKKHLALQSLAGMLHFTAFMALGIILAALIGESRNWLDNLETSLIVVIVVFVSYIIWAIFQDKQPDNEQAKERVFFSCLLILSASISKITLFDSDSGWLIVYWVGLGASVIGAFLTMHTLERQGHKVIRIFIFFMVTVILNVLVSVLMHYLLR